ncbi:metal-dependent hydrolase [Oceanisphaera pacifica]|uniref:Metal-dependent hydrolase n=1 Tax=Oceanisphaera pacifica TaxID=2818389 RepID=A0ABS3NCM5_9GAMM|nr:metal-dependent hydrolase [Oceanisphaera pacifica]MBO1518353.1 metal-dependent hydrolase [Oceanisphaera pacifica]
MANFTTHIQVASIGSGVLAGSLAWSQAISLPEATILWLTGTLGGIMPDIDADTSRSLQIIFRLLSILATTLVLLYGRLHLPLLNTPLIASAAYFTVRYPLCWGFARLTVHRASLHSLLANTVFAIMTVVLSHHLFHFTNSLAWLMGGFMFIGAAIHLLLDELYSIDLEGRRLKRSFGSAFKVMAWPAILPNTALLALLMLGYWLSPSPKPLIAMLQQLWLLSII